MVRGQVVFAVGDQIAALAALGFQQAALQPLDRQTRLRHFPDVIQLVHRPPVRRLTDENRGKRRNDGQHQGEPVAFGDSEKIHFYPLHENVG